MKNFKKTLFTFVLIILFTYAREIIPVKEAQGATVLFLYQGGTGLSTSSPGDLLTGTSSFTAYSPLHIGAPFFLLQSSSTSPFKMEWVSTSTLGLQNSIIAGTGLSFSGNTLNSVWTKSGNDIFNNNTGNVGVGVSPSGNAIFETLAPSGINEAARFDGQSANGNYITFHDSLINTDRAYVGYGPNVISAEAISDFIIRSQGALVFGTNGNNERGRFATDGHLDLATTTGSQQLTVVGDGEFTALSAGSTTPAFVTADNNGILGTTTAPSGGVSTTTITSLDTWIRGNGFIYNATSSDKVGVGSTTPIATLSVQGSSTQPTRDLFDVASSSGSNVFTILSTGSVGVATTSPTSIFSVSGSSTLIGAVAVGYPTTNAVIIGDTTGNARGTNAIDIQSSRVNIGAVASGNCSVILGVQSTSSGVFTSSFGSCNNVTANCSTGFGFCNTVTGLQSVGFGGCNAAICTNTYAIGFCNNACVGTGNFAIGTCNTASGGYAGFGRGTAIGFGNTVSAAYGTAIGLLNTSSGQRATAVGSCNAATVGNATASGYKNTACAGASGAFGFTNNAGTGACTNAFGSLNTAKCALASAFGACNFATGTCASAFGFKDIASAIGSDAFGIANTSSGNYAQAFGLCNTASGATSTALGICNTTSGTCFSSASGYKNTVFALRSDAFGVCNVVCNCCSSALGFCNLASSSLTTTVGSANKSISARSTTVGLQNTTCGAIGLNVAMGYINTNSGYKSDSFGVLNTGSGYYSTSLGLCNTAAGASSTAVGWCNCPSGLASNAFGTCNNAFDTCTSAFGYLNNACCVGAVAIGNSNTASSTCSIAIGIGNTTLACNTGICNNVAMGYFNKACGGFGAGGGTPAVAMGWCNVSACRGSTASGYLNTASGCGSSAMGQQNTSSGNSSAAVGFINTSSGFCSSAIGFCNIASTTNTSAFGGCNVASGTCAVAFGFNNKACCTGSGVFGIGLTNTTPSSIEVGITDTGKIRINTTGIILPTIGQGLQIPVGANALAGTSTLSGGTVTINDTKVQGNAIISITDMGGGVLANIGTLFYLQSDIVANTSFKVCSSNVLDSSTFNYVIWNPPN